VPEAHWHIFQIMSADTFNQTLLQLAEQVNLAKFKKHKRGAKKPQPKRKSDPKKPHVSTAKLLKK
jgi:hypothetical protein